MKLVSYEASVSSGLGSFPLGEAPILYGQLAKALPLLLALQLYRPAFSVVDTAQMH